MWGEGSRVRALSQKKKVCVGGESREKRKNRGKKLENLLFSNFKFLGMIDRDRANGLVRRGAPPT